MADSKNRTDFEENLCVYIFTVSAAMVGVCLTVIGLPLVVIAVRRVDTLADISKRGCGFV